MWAASGGYDFVADSLFNQLEVDGFFLEWDDERSGGFEPLRYLPEGQDRRARADHDEAGELESKDISSAASRRRRSTRTSTSSACRRSVASPRRVEGNDLTIDEQFAKLELVLETAAEVWGE